MKTSALRTRCRIVLVQGNNLDALKALLPFYAGQKKCIYMDPPYNTKSAFEHFDDNLEHAKWLATMWPRLELLRDLHQCSGWGLIGGCARNLDKYM